jgi:hypothetical protein
MRAWRLLAASAFVLALTLLLTTATNATAEVPMAAPINDNYLASLNLNQPHTPLDRADTLTDVRNTGSATLQSDIFSPPESGAPAEVTGCNGVSEGRTIWYDLYPDATGLIRIRTSAEFSTVMAVMPFDSKTLLPEIAQRKCAVNLVSHTQELFDQVKAGQSYTIQIGGANNAGGPVESLFDYLIKSKRIQAEATLTAQPLSGGVRIVNLSVNAPRKTHITVRCTRGCQSQARTARNVSFANLRGKVLDSGSSLRIYVTAKNEIGAYIEYKIHGGSFTKTQRCLRPSSVKPVPCE